MLTHNRDLHEVNLGWHPKAEDALWRPDLQQPKRSQTGCGTCATATTSSGGRAGGDRPDRRVRALLRA